MSVAMPMQPVPFSQNPPPFPQGHYVYPSFALPLPGHPGAGPAQEDRGPPQRDGGGAALQDHIGAAVTGQGLPWKGKRPRAALGGRPPVAGQSAQGKTQSNWGWKAKRRRLEAEMSRQQAHPFQGNATGGFQAPLGRPLAGPPFPRHWPFQPGRAPAARAPVQGHRGLSDVTPRLVDLAKQNKQRARRYYKKSKASRLRAAHDSMPDAPRNTNQFLMRSRLRGPLTVDSPVAPAVQQLPPLPSEDWAQERPKEAWAAEAEALDVNPYGSMSGVIRMKLHNTSEAGGAEEDAVDKEERGELDESEEGSSGSEESDAEADSVQRFEERMDQGLSRFELNYAGSEGQPGEGAWEAGILRHRLLEVEEDNMKLEEDNMNLREKLFLAENLIKELQRRLSRSIGGGSIAPSVDSRGSGGASFAMAALSSLHASSSASDESASSGGNYLGLAYGEQEEQKCASADALCAPGDVDEDADSQQPPSLATHSGLHAGGVGMGSEGGGEKVDLGRVDLHTATGLAGSRDCVLDVS